jgi:hypothetical protein
METIWPGLLNIFETHLKPFCPAPKTSADKQECISVQHLIYLLFVVLESIQDKEVLIVQTDESGNNLSTSLSYNGESFVISPTRNFLLFINNLFGIPNMGIPNLSNDEYSIIVSAILNASTAPLAEMENHIEQWISDNIDNEWNIYIELAEEGDLSVETIAHMQRIQKRLAVLGHKTFRRIHPDSGDEIPKKKGIYLQKHTRKNRKAVSD